MPQCPAMWPWKCGQIHIWKSTHNWWHNPTKKPKHNKTLCIILEMYCISEWLLQYHNKTKHNKTMSIIHGQHWNTKIIWITVLVITGDIEGKLQHPQWWPGQSPWWFFCFCEGAQLHNKTKHNKTMYIILGLYCIPGWSLLWVILQESCHWLQVSPSSLVYTSNMGQGEHQPGHSLYVMEWEF